MRVVEKSVIIAYSAEQMFRLVDGIERYPEFLPWCGGTSVDMVDDSRAHATVVIDYHHIRQSFTTENLRNPPHLIEMTLKDGPFKHLDGHWRFAPLGDDACKIEFRLHYEFAHKMLEKLV